MSTPLISAGHVIFALGGMKAVCRLTGRKETAPYNWRKRDLFPPSTYLALTKALSERGLSAPAWLWGMEDRPSRARRSRAPKAHAAEVA
jgi:hypothetical protein